MPGLIVRKVLPDLIVRKVLLCGHQVGPHGVGRARVTQIFRNPTKNWVEAVYVYPLPDGGAVDTLKMVIGDRVVVGDIKERQQARVIYEQAKQNGQKAALTEQERPNIFTNSVANIGPGETVLVQIEYQEPVRQSGNTFSLRVPMVVGFTGTLAAGFLAGSSTGDEMRSRSGTGSECVAPQPPPSARMSTPWITGAGL